jgi:hypothetical protein
MDSLTNKLNETVLSNDAVVKARSAFGFVGDTASGKSLAVGIGHT